MALIHIRSADDIEVWSDRTITQAVTAPVFVRRGGILVFMGIAEAGIVVCAGGFARISGTTRGLLVAPGGEAILTGTCDGAAINGGGTLTIDGVVLGPLIDESGTARVTPTAVIAARPPRQIRGPI